MNHKYFTINDRNILEVLLKEEYEVKKISRIFVKDSASVYWGIKRINEEYCTEKGQLDADSKAGRKGRKPKIIPELKNEIKARLCDTWLPEQIVSRSRSQC